MAETFKLESIPLLTSSLLSMSRYLLSIKEQPFCVMLHDGECIIKAKWLMVNIFMWRPLLRLGLPIGREHTMTNGLITTKRLAEIQTVIYNNVVSAQADHNGVAPPEVIRDIQYDLTESLNDLHTMIVTQLGQYHLSISAFELADLLLNEEVASLTKIDVEHELKIGISAVEKKLGDQGRLLIEKLKDNNLPSNVLAPFLELGQLNTNQLAAVVYALGYRNDSDANYVKRPILTSYVNGFRDILDFATDSLAAKKSTYYNADAMPGSQYNNRIQQLLSNVIWHIYPQDCGSTITVAYHIHKDNYRNVVHKNIVENGQLVQLNKQNIESYVDKVVQFRSPLTCKHTDGVCRICGGRLIDFMPAQTVLGIACTVEYISIASQLVLSSKHFSKTNVLNFHIPDNAKDFLVVKQNDIYIRDNIDVNRIKVSLLLEDVPYINELKKVDRDKIGLDDVDDGEEAEDKVPIMEQQFSSIRSIVFYDAATDEPLSSQIDLSSDGTIPYLSSRFLLYLSDNFKNITVTDNVVTISLRHFNHINNSFLGYVVMSSSMLNFNKELGKFFTDSVKSYTSLKDTLRDFSSLVYKEIPVNIFHLEVVLKSYLITDAVNYNVPVVYDPEEVRFGTLFKIMSRRSLGSVYAYQRLSDYMKTPEWYTQPHKQSMFDLFFYPQE